MGYHLCVCLGSELDLVGVLEVSIRARVKGVRLSVYGPIMHTLYTYSHIHPCLLYALLQLICVVNGPIMHQGDASLGVGVGVCVGIGLASVCGPSGVCDTYTVPLVVA